MKKIITAIGEPSLNEKLGELKDVDVIQKDIFYKEGILEFLEENSDIDIVIINRELLEEDCLAFLKQILYYDVEIMLLIENCIQYLDDFKQFEEIKLVKSKDEIISILDPSREIVYENISSEIRNNKRVISCIGSVGVGKTVISSIIAKELSKNNKVLIIDFDIFGNNINFLFNLKKNITSCSLESLINKVSNNLYVLSDIKYIFNEKNKIEKYKVKEMLEELKRKFDYLIIDTSSETYLKYVKTILPNCDYNIFIVEPNSLEVKKAKLLLETYCYDFELELTKTEILVNKYNEESMDLEILRDIFEKIQFLGTIKYNSKFNAYINTYTKNSIKIDAIIKTIQKIEGRVEINNGKFNRIRKCCR